MVPVQLVVYAAVRVNLLQNLIRIFLRGCCEDCYLEYFADFFEEFFSERANVKNLPLVIIVNQSLIQVKDQVFILVSGWKVGVGWHFKNLPL